MAKSTTVTITIDKSDIKVARAWFTELETGKRLVNHPVTGPGNKPSQVIVYLTFYDLNYSSQDAQTDFEMYGRLALKH